MYFVYNKRTLIGINTILNRLYKIMIWVRIEARHILDTWRVLSDRLNMIVRLFPWGLEVLV